MNKKTTDGLRTWIEINKSRLEHNYQTLRQIAGDSRLMAVCKSNAYGHSLIDFAKEAERLGVDWLGVDSILEALKLRKNKINLPILVLGYTLPELIDQAVANNISISISNFESLKSLENTKADNLKIHLKFDTGMCRQGFFAEEVETVLNYLSENLPLIKIEGVYTHFGVAKNPAFPQSVKQQLAKFSLVLDALAKRNLKPIRHASATAGAIIFDEAKFDLIRIGIGFYGLWPSLATQMVYADKFELKPILSWKTVVAEIKKVPEGSRVGYDGTELLMRQTIIGVLPVGYWHGYDRSLSSIGKVLVRGQQARVLGRVSMDMIVVDLTDIPGATVGDEVVLIGSQGQNEISADIMADLADTSSYEIVTRLNPLIKRIYV